MYYCISKRVQIFASIKAKIKMGSNVKIRNGFNTIFNWKMNRISHNQWMDGIVRSPKLLQTVFFSCDDIEERGKHDGPTSHNHPPKNKEFHSRKYFKILRLGMSEWSVLFECTVCGGMPMLSRWALVGRLVSEAISFFRLLGRWVVLSSVSILWTLYTWRGCQLYVL